jgi:hypothetical protein
VIDVIQTQIQVFYNPFSIRQSFWVHQPWMDPNTNIGKRFYKFLKTMCIKNKIK